MDSVGYGIAAMRRGSYDDAAASLRPHLRHLAQRRRSAPSLAFGRALGVSWSPIREEASCWVSAEQSPFVLGLAGENGELLLDERVQVTEGPKTTERHLFLFSDVIVFAKLKSNISYRLKHRVSLQDIWLHGFQDDLEGEEGQVDLRVTLALAWPLAYCLVCFRSPEVKERWSDTLHSKIKESKAKAGRASPPPDVLMKVLSGSFTPKALPGGGMERFIEFPLDSDFKVNNQEEKLLQPIETKWNLVRKLKKGSSFISRARQSDAKTQLFGRPLSEICPDDGSLPKPVIEMLVLLRRKGPSTEGVFRKPCNSKMMRDIKEQLNGGLEVDMDIQPVTMLSFLKELPGSLLVSELYVKWMMTLDNEETQQRAQKIRKMVEMLPAANQLLLQHLLCVLHHILENADINKMDAYNLAVCIAPTLLQVDAAAPLDEQKGKIEKVTELTQFLIEHSDILGENIPNLLDADNDSLSSQHHDSAYDSTDPDGDGEAGESASSTLGESGSSSSLGTPVGNTSSWPADAIFNTKTPFNRRCSEPIILLSPDLENLCSHARSHDDCSAKRSDFEEQSLKKPISDDSLLLRGQKRARPVLSLSKPKSSSNVDLLPNIMGSQLKDCSCSSLESAASNQSEGSVFASSPVESPTCPRRTNPTNQSSTMAKTQQDIPSEEKRRSQSMRLTSKVLMRTRSLGAFSRNTLKKDPQRENPFPCETLQEDSQSEADSPVEFRHKPRPLSAIEVFKLVDSRLPCRPPSYEHAVQNTGLHPPYGSMTVQDAFELERRSRPSSLNFDFPSTFSVSQYKDGLAEATPVDNVKLRQPFRQRAMSESVSTRHHEVVSRRCSQPVFEEFSYAKESYV
ncbi:T cell activation RhoGTPase activating protein b isoform X2 [Antennarius striatus]|uniref:T cell activation RhoGTPase activating protein b isoform X2 n=1 Tax=Antennarius striatus TaxID=241820 RepID=UPI0035B28030